MTGQIGKLASTIKLESSQCMKIRSSVIGHLSEKNTEHRTPCPICMILEEILPPLICLINVHFRSEIGESYGYWAWGRREQIFHERK